MSLLTANLPSSDEEDDDYDPSKDKTGEPEDRPGAGSKPAGSVERKRRRGAAPGAGAQESTGDAVLSSSAVPPEAVALKAEDDPRLLAKKAKVDILWQQLNGKTAAGVASLTPVASSSNRCSSTANVSLAALCRPSGRGKKVNPDESWMRSLGMLPKKPNGPSTGSAEALTPGASTSGAAPGAGPTPAEAGLPSSSGGAAAAQPSGSSRPVSEAARASAAAALAAARDATSATAGRNANKVQLTETRKFAGKDIQVTVSVDKDSKEAQRMAEKAARAGGTAASGLDAFIAEIETKKKVSVLDKSKMDWQEAKKGDAALEEELEAHKRSGSQYLDKKDFLKRAELREYEQERDKRLAADMRTRGRL